jgi:hypothetical protein
MLIAFILILIHYVADFMYQDDRMALNKSKSNKELLRHTFRYTLVFMIGFLIIKLIENPFPHIYMYDLHWTYKILWFFPITFVCHTIIDYISSRITSKLFANNIYYTGIPNFGAFSIIGMDQVFHYATLFLTYNYLT